MVIKMDEGYKNYILKQIESLEKRKQEMTLKRLAYESVIDELQNEIDSLNNILKENE